MPVGAICACKDRVIPGQETSLPLKPLDLALPPFKGKEKGGGERKKKEIIIYKLIFSPSPVGEMGESFQLKT